MNAHGTEHTLAHGLLANIHATTPGGVTRARIVARHWSTPLKTAIAWLPFVALTALSIINWISR